MKTAQILGMEPTSICILADMLKEMQLATHLDIFLNIKLDIVPITPIHSFSYKIYSQLSQPSQSEGVIFGPSGPKNKFEIYSYYHNLAQIDELCYLTIIHPTTYIAESTQIAKGVLVEPLVTISSQTKIGFGVTVKRSCSIGHHNYIGEYTDLNPGVVTSGGVSIGRGCILGSGVTVKDGAQIGDNSYIGMGSVVTKDIPENSIAYGNPCKVVRSNDLWKI